ncbi:MAG: hypothetical protein MR935_05800, partial [Agathobaculum sp.]|uniref:hypothetical protein n=1 Tax=Agathobaculum sp. TaxID=2048138 RepID=UPI0025BCB192
PPCRGPAMLHVALVIPGRCPAHVIARADAGRGGRYAHHLLPVRLPSVAIAASLRKLRIVDRPAARVDLPVVAFAQLVPDGVYIQLQVFANVFFCLRRYATFRRWFFAFHASLLPSLTAPFRSVFRGVTLVFLPFYGKK